MEEAKASCPFNAAHTFAPEKFIFHLNRCKDRQKVQHLFRRCQFNSLHFIPKQEIESHQLMCPDAVEVKRLTEMLKKNFERIRNQRERSRERVKREQMSRHQKIQVSFKEQNDDDLCLSDCDECNNLLQNLCLEVSPNNQKLQKYLSKYNQIREECKRERKS